MMTAEEFAVNLRNTKTKGVKYMKHIQKHVFNQIEGSAKSVRPTVSEVQGFGPLKHDPF